MQKLKEITNKYNIVEITPLSEGWSNDEKYILKDKSGYKYLIRISDISKYDKKAAQYEYLKQLEKLGINAPKPFDFGRLPNNETYLLLSWIEGEPAQKVVPSLSNKEAYEMGIKAGEMLYKIHSVQIELPNITWWERHIEKLPRKVNKLINCEYELPLRDKIIKYYQDNSYLIKNRPMVFSHGDYHVGNMVISDNEIGIIDFDKCGPADPYDEIKPFCWNVLSSEYFETGLINGYFNNEIPNDFFPILKFGEKEIQVALEIANHVLNWYDNFDRDIPSWYKGIIE